jgi:hypothetical protein
MDATFWWGVAFGWLGSGLTGLALWFVLPRGAVLTRHPIPNVHHAWKVQNESPVTIQLRSVKYRSLSAVGEGTESGHYLPWHDLPIDCDDLDPDPGVRLRFDDRVTDQNRERSLTPWVGLPVEPGDTLTAYADRGEHAAIKIEYRRAGWWGRFERREILLNAEH